ncbi:DotU family type IV/VI secretion system protein [Paraburkholderia sp.]|uniref:DotU family type IV/VI secretion system protein n=1 Tax=Paraburkholderia sp. TaxID=1926495 RepID=UPI0039E38488
MTFESPAPLMRATALYAALLRGGAEIPAIHVWRARCGSLVETLRQAMQDNEYPAAAIDEVSLAQSVLLDELTLRALSPPRQNEWLRESLQMRFHGLRDGAARVWGGIDVLLDGGRQDRAALELYGILLELGFEGGREDAAACRQRVRLVLNRLTQGDAATFASVVNAASPSSRTSGTSCMSSRPSSRWMAAGAIVAAVAVIASLWIVFNAGLGASIDRLSQAHAGHGGLVRKAHSS